jgi:hypothetical protein
LLAQLAQTLGKLDASARAHSPSLLPVMQECMLHICALLPGVLAECSLQDLENALWGIATLFPGGASGTQGHALQVSLVPRAIVRQLAQRVTALTTTSVAASFWAIARLKIHGPDVEEYMRLALVHACTSIMRQRCTPQGLMNVLCALAHVRLTGAVKGPQEDSVRWQDTAYIAVALSHCQQKSQSAMDFVTMLTRQAALCAAKTDLTLQLLLNIAQSAAAMHVPPESTQGLVKAIEARIVTRPHELSKAAKRQWGQVQQWCQRRRHAPQGEPDLPRPPDWKALKRMMARRD